jgi:diguanylate cyclase (GGDEF)-like protein/putative nucleotidyltransferase with HDIG domain
MRFPAKIYVGLMIAAGAAAIGLAIARWELEQPLRFLFFLISSVVAGRFKVTLPGVKGTMSVTFVLMLLGVTDLGLSQAVAIGMAGVLAQNVVRSKEEVRCEQLAFNLASIAVAVTVSSAVFESVWLRRLDGGFALSLAAAGIAFFVCNTWSVALVIALTEGRRPYRVWYESFFWTGPQYMCGVGLVGLVHVLTVYGGWIVALLAAPVVYLVYHSYRLYLMRLQEEKNHAEDVAGLHLRTIKALALAIDAKDNTTHDHLQRVEIYAAGIGRELGLSDDEMRALETASLLHDIGKLAVPEYIISKPGRLTPEEFEKMKIHPIVGAEILACVRFPYPVAPIVLAHHERWDGRGYPNNLKGEEIPIGARILAVVDCLDALASDRQYRRALPLDEAMRHVASESGKSFDPRVVAALERVYVELEREAQAAGASLAGAGTARRPTAPILAGGVAPANGYEHARASGQPEEIFLASIAAARQEFQALHEITAELGNSLSVPETLSLLALRLKPLIPYDSIVIYMARGGRLLPEYIDGENARLFASLEIPLGEGLSGWVVQNNRPILNGNPSVEPGYLSDPARFSTLRSSLSVPLPGREDVLGAITLYHLQENAFTRDHLRLLQAIQIKAGLTIENALRFQQASSTAVTDELTGLPNARSLFLQLDAELARSKRSGEPLSVLALDLDGFKHVNDRFGHALGNQVLQQTAAGLRECCREYDYVARMGGDEFVMILPGARAAAVRDRLRQFQEAARLAGARVCGDSSLTVSAGMAFYPDDGEDAEQLLACADQRMYQMKHPRLAVLPAPLEVMQ